MAQLRDITGHIFTSELPFVCALLHRFRLFRGGCRNFSFKYKRTGLILHIFPAYVMSSAFSKSFPFLCCLPFLFSSLFESRRHSLTTAAILLFSMRLALLEVREYFRLHILSLDVYRPQSIAIDDDQNWV